MSRSTCESTRLYSERLVVVCLDLRVNLQDCIVKAGSRMSRSMRESTRLYSERLVVVCLDIRVNLQNCIVVVLCLDLCRKAV